jgi:hypothetical protein
MEAYNQPQYENMAIPGLNSVEAGLSPEGWEKDFGDNDGRDSKALRIKQKFNIKSIMGDGQGNRKDDQDSFFDGFDNPEEDWRLQLNKNERKADDEVVSRDWLNDRLLDGDDDTKRFISSGNENDLVSTLKYRPGQDTSDDDGNSNDQGSEYSDDFDSDLDDDDDVQDVVIDDRLNVHESFVRKQQQHQYVTDRDALVQAMAEATNDLNLAEDLIPKNFRLPADVEDDEKFNPDDEWFDEDEFNKLMEETMNGIDDSKGGEAEELDSIPGVANNDFVAFRAHLQQELVNEGSKQKVDVKEARQLFDMMRTYYDEKHANDTPTSDYLDNCIIDESSIVSQHAATNNAESKPSSSMMNSSQVLSTCNDLYDTPVQRHRIPATSGVSNKTTYADDFLKWTDSGNEGIDSSRDAASSSDNKLSEAEPLNPIDVALPRQYTSPLIQSEQEAHIVELQKILPGMPMNRIEKVADEFSRTLGYPSILRLTLAVRENMPEAFSPQCLTRVNLANAKHVMVS